MKLRHLNGHAALHALQLPTAPPRMADVAKELSRRSQGLERGGKLIRRGAQPKVGTMPVSSQLGRPGEEPATVGADHGGHELAAKKWPAGKPAAERRRRQAATQDTGSGTRGVCRHHMETTERSRAPHPTGGQDRRRHRAANQPHLHKQNSRRRRRRESAVPSPMVDAGGSRNSVSKQPQESLISVDSGCC